MAWRKTDTGIIHFISEEAGLWTDVVSKATKISVEELLRLAEFGGIYLNDSRIRQDQPVKIDDYLRLHTNPRRFPRMKVSDLVVWENQNILIVNKPSGLPCHPTVDNLKENLLVDLQEQTLQRILPTHRLDVPTSGLMVFAKNPEAQLYFQNLLKDKKVQKIYEAHVPLPGPELGFYEHYMEKSPYAPKTLVDSPRPNTQVCQLKIIHKQILENEAVVQVELITGRTHQIRAQLSYLGFPIIGDSLYSDCPALLEIEKIKLTCIHLRFPWSEEVISCDLKPSPSTDGPIS